MIKHLDKIIAFLFLIWGIFIITYYFYSYPAYGDSFIFVITILFSLIVVLINIIIIAYVFKAVLCPEKSIKKYFIEKKKYIGQKIKFLKIPLYFFPLFLYFAAILWIIFIYFKSSNNIVFLGNNIISLFLVSWIFLISFSLGYKTLKLFRYKTSSFLEKFLFSCALGFGILMIMMFLLGMFNLYYQSVAYILIFGISIITYKEIIELWKYLTNKNKQYKPSSNKFIKNILIIFIIIILCIYIAGIFQQTPFGFDSLISYLNYPKVYAENHGIVNFPYWIYYGFPQNGEMLFVLGFLLYNFQIALGIIYIYTLLVALLIYYFFRKNKFKGGLFAVIIYLMLPVISFQNLEDHKIEMIFVFYVVLAFVLFINYLKSKNIKNLIILAIISGIAAGIKYFFLLWFVVPIILFFIIEIFRKKIKLKEFALWGMIILIILSPWLIKNIKFSGNPIDPILSEVFASKQKFYNSLGIDSQKYIINEMRNESYLIWDDEEKKDLKYFLKLPFKITFEGYKKYISDGLSIGPIFLLLMPLVILAILRRRTFAKHPKKEMIILLFSVILLGLGFIYIGHVVIWYGIGFYVLLSILMSQIFLTKNKYLKLSLYTFLIIWIITMANTQFFKRMFFMPFYSSDAGLFSDKIYSISKYINNNIKENEVVWGIDEARGYHIDNSNKRFIQDNYLLAFSYLIKNNNKKEVYRIFENYNIKYFLWKGKSLNISERMLWAKMPNGSEKYAEMTLNNYKEVVRFKNKHMELVAKEGEFYLYKLKDDIIIN